MKHCRTVLLLLLIGCSTDLDINMEHSTVPVIYSLMNPFDSVQYVRVQRTFVIHGQDDWSTLNADSLQFQDVEVFLHGKSGATVKWTEQFSKIMIDRDSGFFPTQGFGVFQLDHALPIKLSKPIGHFDLGSPDIDSLILEVKIHETDLTARAAAPVLTPYLLVTEPGGGVIYLYGDMTTKFSLPGGGEECDPGKENCYRQIEFNLHYKDYFNNSYAIREISWMTNSGWDEVGWYNLTPERLFNRMKQLLPKSNDIIYRKLDSIDITIIKPSKCFSDWWFVKDYWESSDNPPYTNFDNSYGLFITYLIGSQTGFVLNRQSMDTLCNGYLYKEMKFRN
jgi:hypothetical protein